MRFIYFSWFIFVINETYFTFYVQVVFNNVVKKSLFWVCFSFSFHHVSNRYCLGIYIINLYLPICYKLIINYIPSLIVLSSCNYSKFLPYSGRTLLRAVLISVRAEKLKSRQKILGNTIIILISNNYIQGDGCNSLDILLI